MSTLEELVQEFNEEMENKKTEQAEKIVMDYTLPCQPGDDFWYIENFAGSPLRVRKGKVKMVGFTSDSIQVSPLNEVSKISTKTYIWGKTAFATKEEAEEVFKEATEKTSYSFFRAFMKSAAEKSTDNTDNINTTETE